MQDLDLDELDQAVTQLMDKPKKKAAAKKPDAPKTVAAKVAPEPPKAAPAERPVTITVTQKTPLARPLAAPAPRKRMRPGAMDIIQRPATPPRRPKREAASLQPTKQVAPEPVQPVAPTPMPSAPAPAPEVSDDLLASLNLLEDTNKTVKPKPTEAPAPVAEAWPDPIDLHDFGDTKKDEPQPEPPVAPVPDLLADEPPTLQSAPADEPAPSPFVTTKVEKRPLGAYAAATPEPEAPAAIPVPSEEASKADMAEASLQSSNHLDTPDESEADMQDLRHMAIPQQYRAAQPKSSDVVHNMFDTKEYHAPPQPMRTERHGGSWLITSIVVLVVLIVGVVAVGYLMMTGVLDIGNIW